MALSFNRFVGSAWLFIHAYGLLLWRWAVSSYLHDEISGWQPLTLFEVLIAIRSNDKWHKRTSIGMNANAKVNMEKLDIVKRIKHIGCNGNHIVNKNGCRL